MKKLLICAVLFSFVIFPAEADTSAFSNSLSDHPSPYLAMHGNDPVHWQVWGEEAVQLAKKLDRPLFISSGYFSCHWCHVMQRESYQDPELANILNTYFIPVKIDRELNPALDSHLIEFVQLTQGRAGWPLNVFLTPEGYPMLGMTYLPRDRFYSVLTQVKERWETGPDELRRISEEALEEWRGMRASGTTPVAVHAAIAPKFIEQAQKLMDEMSGGFGEQNKFPMTLQLKALLKVREQDRKKNLDRFLRLTLDRMAGQGMHDLVGGGFFRYTVDPGWETPHYEKMLYDNAQLVSLYLQAAGALKQPRYRDTAFETLDFMLREMWRGEYFISSFSAVDAQGKEGAYYLWSDKALRKLLSSDEYALIQEAWFSDDAPESAWGRLPRILLSDAELSKRLKQPASELHKRMGVIRAKMMKVRASRSLPADVKGLAAWNGLALTALADAVAADGGDAYRRYGDLLANYLATRLWDGERLVRARDKGQSLAEGSLQDYALVAQGLYDWSQVSGDTAQARLSRRLVSIAWQRFYRKGRWLETDTPLIPMLDGKLALDDNPLPSATALISGLSLSTDALRKDEKISKAVSSHLEDVRTRLSDSIFWYASYVEWLE
ncbi:Uncharacterized protein YyaL [hydrothermal vent metagenome]|uniref:Uncharacterized protein YyaL n=1 Tax=hydrothermal vent metagenome TaxID=652676 RepID=A0A3B0YIV9_9ZZZZ